MKNYLLFSFSMIGQIGFAVAIPLVGFGLLGRYLDNKFSTGPYLFLTCLVIATVIAFFAVRSIARKSISQMNDELSK